MDLSFVVPCYCSEKTLDGVINNIYSAMQLLPTIQFEVILVNDNSTDGTWGEICRLSAIHREILGINFSKNFGQHNALISGFKASTGALIMTSDDDGQTSADYIFDFFNKINEGYDVVCARYTKRNRKGLMRSIGSWLNNYLLCHVLEKPNFVDMSSFFIAKRFIIDEVCRYDKPFPYLAGLLLRATSNVGNVDVVQKERVSGQSGYSFNKLVKLWTNGLTNFSIKPLRVAIILGFAVAFLGLSSAFMIVAQKFFLHSISLPGYTSIISIICIIGGMNLSVVGIVGEYIGRIYMCINNQPQYVIKSEVANGIEKDVLSPKGFQV